MPLTPELRRSIDRIRNHLFGGGYPNPSQNAEQLSFLFYFCMFETADAAHVRAARRPGAEPYRSPFEEDWKLRNPRNALAPGASTVPGDSLRWSRWAKAMTGERLVSWVREEVFPFYAEVAAEGATDFMEGARLVIDEPAVLAQVVAQVDALHLEEVDADTKGDLFEHVLRQIRQAGELGQFRTPRHVIRALVRLVDPRFGETVCDPAAGTGGFLVGAWDHIRLANSTSAGIEELEADGKAVRRGIGDRLAQADMARLRRETLFGMDVDPQMVRLATMNLTLRGLEEVPVHRRDALTRTLDRAEKASLGLPLEGFDVMLANPPFSGRVDRDRVVEDVKVGRTGQTELLFLQYMLNHLKPGGRCGVVVPEGVLFGSTGAHRELRRKLIETTGWRRCCRCRAACSTPMPASRPRFWSSERAGRRSASCSSMPTMTATSWTPTTTRPSTKTTCRRWSRRSRTAKRASPPGPRATRRRTGPKTGGSQRRARSAKPTGTSAPAATAPSTAPRRNTAIRWTFWKNCGRLSGRYWGRSMNWLRQYPKR